MPAAGNREDALTGAPPLEAEVSPARPPAEFEREALVDEIVRRLEERGLPPGAWLADVVQVRRALHEADGLLRRLQNAIIEGSRPRPGS